MCTVRTAPSSFAPLLFPALVFLVLPGCGGDLDRSGEAVVSDSAGVRIVVNPDGDFADRSVRWTVSEAPEVAIGDQAGDDAYLFDRIMGIDRLTDGRWVVADMGSSQIRWFDPEGRHLRSAGSRGEGPGEFFQVMGLTRLAGDTLLVDDARTRTHMLDESGEFVGESTATGSPVGERTDPTGVLRDGTVVAATTSAFPQRLTSPQPMTRTYHRARLDRGEGRGFQLEVLDTIGRWDLRVLVPGWNESSQRVRFEEGLQVALLGDGLVVADPMRFEVRTVSVDGELRSISRFDWTPYPVTDADVERKRDEYIHHGGESGSEVSPQLLQQRSEIADSWEISDHMPAFSEVIVDRLDHIWLREYVPNEPTAGSWIQTPLDPVRWLVLSPDGEVVAGVETPARFRPRVIGEDFIAGLHRDEMEVEYVHAYSLIRH